MCGVKTCAWSCTCAGLHAFSSSKKKEKKGREEKRRKRIRNRKEGDKDSVDTMPAWSSKDINRLLNLYCHD